MKDTAVNIDEKMSVEEVLGLLETSLNGLSEEEVKGRLEEYGPNALPEKKRNKILEFLSFLWNPLSWVMEMAAFIAIAVANGGGEPPDYTDFIGIVVLLLLNAIIGFWENNQASNAVAALMAALALQAKAKRDGNWKTVDAKDLVPGDIISMKLGDVIPADAMLTSGGSAKVDQAALTGESLPVEKHEGDEVYSGATVKQGEIEGVVIATGTRTFFGKAAKLVSETENSGHFQQVMVKIGLFCLSVIAIFVFIEILVMYIDFKYPYRRGINNVLVLLIGGVPIAMPIVLSVTLAIGAHQLAQKKAIVTRMTAIEELAAMDVLCSDKTGTLTLNKLTIDDENMVILSEGVTIAEMKQKAAFASRLENQDAIDAAIINTLPKPEDARLGIRELSFMPFDPVGKRTEITYEELATGKRMRVTKGAPQIISGLCGDDPKQKATVARSIEFLAQRGLRALGVAECEVTPDMKLTDQVTTWKYLGLLPIFDPPRLDTAETIQKAHERGISVKMITGDQLAIGKETARRLGLGTNMYETEYLMRERASIEAETGKSLGQIIEASDGFAGVFPEHKYEIVNTLRNMKHIVGMTGDGVNDAPALKIADIGIAVDGATDAARGAADIVLTEPGLSVIIDAIDGSRKIFKRMKTYATYACTVTVRIVINFAVLCFAWQFDFPPFMVLIIAFLNDGAIMTISKDRVKPSMSPDSWRLREIFIVGTALGLYLTISTVVFFYTLNDTDFWSSKFGLETPWRQSGQQNDPVLHSIIYLNVSITGQAVIFSVRSQTTWFMERPGAFLMMAFAGAQFVATIITVYANWGFTEIAGTGWGWALAIWVWSLLWVFPIDAIKHIIIFVSRSDVWRNMQGMVVMSYDREEPPVSERIHEGSTRASIARASIDTQTQQHRAVLRESMSKIKTH